MSLSGEFKVMKLIDLKRKIKQEVGVSTHISITHLCSPTIFETKQGMLGMVLKIKGLPFVTETNEKLNENQRLIHQAILKLNHEFLFYETRIRRKKHIKLEGEFSQSFAKRVNEKYKNRFNQSNLYTNEIYWAILYKNQNSIGGKSRPIDKLFQLGKKLSDKNLSKQIKINREKGIKKLTHKVAEIKSLLSSANVCVLGEQDSDRGFSELLAFLSLIPNGSEAQTIHTKMKANSISSDLQKLVDEGLLYPKGNIAPYLCNHRLFFGDVMQFQGNNKKSFKLAAMMSLKQYNSDSASVIMDPLMQLDGEYVLTQSFVPIERDLAIKEIKRCHSIKVNSEDLSASQIEELGLLADWVASEKVSCGFHHNSLMLLADDEKQLEYLIHEATKAYSKANMAIVRETLGQVPAFFAQIPGNAHCIARCSLITSENMADFASLHNTQTGHHQKNFLGSAVTLLETPAKTPVYFNYHVEGSKTNPSRGHALVIGGNDSGKTTLVSFLDAQMMRFNNHRAIFLDRNNGLKIYIKAMNGAYSTIAPTHQAQCQMNPLALPDTAFNRDFCKSWLSALLLQEGESSLPGSLVEVVNEAVDYCFDSLAPSKRVLSNLAQFFPMNFSRLPELRRWLRESDDRGAGQYSWVFDNESDTLTLEKQRIGFDITYILDNFPEMITTPIFMYIMHRIELCLDGNLTSIVVDEMWQVLRSPYWKNWLEERLPSIRKDYGHIIGMTQSPKTIIESDISSELLDNLATLVLFPNPKAEQSVYIDRLGLTEAEFYFIKNNSPQSRLFLYKHDTDSMVCRLDLSDLSDAIRIFSGNKSSVQLMEKLIAEKGDTPSQWLEDFIEESKTI